MDGGPALCVIGVVTATPASPTAASLLAIADTRHAQGMGLDFGGVHVQSKFAVLALAILQGACAATPPPTVATGAAEASGTTDLACLLPSNCVSSRGSGALAPLPYAGTPVQAMAMLQAALKTFPEATVVRNEPLAMEVIFTTPAGFRDQVDFRIDPPAQRVDFRSRSLFGLFDWGKNRSRMQEFRTRFEQPPRS